MGLFGSSTPDYGHGNNAQSADNSGTRHGTSRTIRGGGSSGGGGSTGGTYGGGATDGA